MGERREWGKREAELMVEMEVFLVFSAFRAFLQMEFGEGLGLFLVIFFPFLMKLFNLKCNNK